MQCAEGGHGTLYATPAQDLGLGFLVLKHTASFYFLFLFFISPLFLFFSVCSPVCGSDPAEMWGDAQRMNYPSMGFRRPFMDQTDRQAGRQCTSQRRDGKMRERQWMKGKGKEERQSDTEEQAGRMKVRKEGSHGGSKERRMKDRERGEHIWNGKQEWRRCDKLWGEGGRRRKTVRGTAWEDVRKRGVKAMRKRSSAPVSVSSFWNIQRRNAKGLPRSSVSKHHGGGGGGHMSGSMLNIMWSSQVLNKNEKDEKARVGEWGVRCTVVPLQHTWQWHTVKGQELIPASVVISEH